MDFKPELMEKLNKLCIACGKNKPSSEFYKNNATKDGLNYSCKKCSYRTKLKNKRTKNGLISKIFSTQISNSKIRNYPLLNYSIRELREWLLGQPLFHKLFNEWVESEYKKDLRPSCDRINDYKGYSLKNLQLMTWEENRLKGTVDRKNGINNKNSKAVVGTHKDTGKRVEFYSMMEAQRTLNILACDISRCCNNHSSYSHAGGYVWKFKNVI